MVLEVVVLETLLDLQNLALGVKADQVHVLH